MSREISLGRRGEQLALRWLEAKGLVLLESNWRWNHKEIDLIMESSDAIHFIEVKTLRAPVAHQPWEGVNPVKQRNISRAAEHFIFERHIRKEAHFDVVSIIFDGDTPSLEYIPEAFFPIYRR